jgi:hypothetical protein
MNVPSIIELATNEKMKKTNIISNKDNQEKYEHIRTYHKYFL